MVLAGASRPGEGHAQGLRILDANALGHFSSIIPGNRGSAHLCCRWSRNRMMLTLWVKHRLVILPIIVQHFLLIRPTSGQD